MADPAFLTDRLARLRAAGQYRALPGTRAGVDFWSNDYLGFSRLLAEHRPAAMEHTAPGSRLISGDSGALTDLERDIAAFHGHPAALLFGSGYTANLGLLSALGRRGDTIIFDALCHASLRDGLRLSGAAARRFEHNDVGQCAELLQRSAGGDGQVFVVTEGRFSMDGDVGPLRDLADLCARHGAHLIVDEAHSVGLDGPRGAGMVAALGLQARVLATVVTYGKAPGYHGAAILGSAALRDVLINTCRPFIFTTGPRPEQIAGWRAVYALLRTEQSAARDRLQRVVDHYREGIRRRTNLSAETTDGPIQLIHLPGNDAVMAAEARLLADGLLVKGIRSPSVKEGQERLRICLHAFNTAAEVDRLLEGLSTLNA